MGRLNGRAALITGGTTGLGFAIAERFLDEGARLFVTGRDEGIGTEAASRLSSHGEARFLAADAAVEEQVLGSVEETVRRLGGLDILVNNAGVGVVAGVLDTPTEAFDTVMAVNLRGYFLYSRAAFPHLRERGGCMIHISSDAGVLGEPEIGAYSISKAAVIMLSNVLAIEAGRHGVRSNCLSPGDIRPGMRHMGPPGDPDRPEDDDAATWPLPPVGRIGEAADVAGAALFLASDDAAFCNGVNLLVDGGMRAGHNAGLRPGARS